MLSNSIRRSTSQCARDQLSCLFHTTTGTSGQFFKRTSDTRAPSRTRLVKDLTPSSSSHRLEVAPRESKSSRPAAFTRDDLPHNDASVPRREERNPSFRRRREPRDEDRRPGLWGRDRAVDESRGRDYSRHGLSDGNMRGHHAGTAPYNEGRSDHRPDPRRSFDSRQRSDHQSDRPDSRRSFDEPSDGRRQPFTGRSSPRPDHLRSERPDSRRSFDEPRSSSRSDYIQSERPDSRRSFDESRSFSPRPGARSDYVQSERPDSRRYFAESRETRQRQSERPDPTPRAESRDSRPPRHRDQASLLTEFYHPPALAELPSFESTSIQTSGTELATRFTSPPLMPGLLSCLTDILGPGATPTPIQSLSLKWLLDGNAKSSESAAVPDLGNASGWKQFLLASETGSGKSIAYLLPVLQSLKQSELRAASPGPPPVTGASQRPLNPRALILAPTHELSRQLSGFAKALLHQVKLRVLCASRANVKNTKERDGTSSQMAAQFEEEIRRSRGGAGEFEVRKEGRAWPVDVLVGTPMKLLEMVRGRGWDRKEGEDEEGEDVDERKPRRGRDKMVGFGKWRVKPEMGLANVEWVVVDEADVLFDPDFQETTRQLLADISAARGTAVPFSPQSSLSAPAVHAPTPEAPPAAPATTEKEPINYPFNLVLTSATIPSALASYLDKHHPNLMRLASPNLHQLPKTLQTEYVNWTGGNKFADIERRVRRVWAEDSSGPVADSASTVDGVPQRAPLSKVLIFCNRSSKVHELGAYLEEKGIKTVALTSTSEERRRGSNHHLDGFLRSPTRDREEHRTEHPSATQSDPKENPHVMITTSLLSRGLDFSPAIRHVFIVDEPRNMVDFLHRAGRSGRAGQRGRVVVFGKMKGRGSAKAKDVRKRVGGLLA